LNGFLYIFQGIPRLLKPLVPSSRQRAWSPLAVSAVVHLLALLTAAGLTRQTPSAQLKEHPDGGPEEPKRRVDMIYMPPEPKRVPPPPKPPPPKPEPPQPPKVRQPPPPPVRQAIPEPEPNAPPDATKEKGQADEAGGVPTPAPPKTTAETPTPAQEKVVATMESEARRIFGSERLATRPGVGPRATRPMESYMPENPERCIPEPSAQAEPGKPIEFGTVVGRIFRQDNGKPLAGAHLQMIGTPYVAFTDGRGEYRFRFDASLMGNCRTQYVRVTAPGYESRLLILVLGPNRSEDVRLRRR
jgi:hypothetical protein